ncbi:OLC1v1004209C1 [Oldenlandia corymbosa var. corymbosa]|uniref:OLC1v1004209C1 n=1 Tax=Oldenlandia corymbosa var. corymbosa TaxID=529605 RepID=A0AAV1DF53_OLDCO|nr:OLC1v1004209C1 [Oldenlandia corymbosa var. corymbosa]
MKNDPLFQLIKSLTLSLQVVKLTEDTLNKSHLPIIASSETAANSPYNLPDGWIIEEVPRSNASHIDKYYYEPGTGRKFRSLSAAQRHAAELNEDAPLSALVEEIKDMNRPLSQTIKLCQGVKKPSSSNKKSTKTSDQTSSFVDLPEKVEWVLHSHRGDEWKPFLCDRAIPDSLKEQWRERFLVAMNANNRTHGLLYGTDRLGQLVAFDYKTNNEDQFGREEVINVPTYDVERALVKLTEDTLNKCHLPIIASSETAANSTPDGWVVEEVPRSNASHIDKESGRKFRLSSAAQRHAAELNEDAPLSALVEEIKDMNTPLSKTIKLCQGAKVGVPLSELNFLQPTRLLSLLITYSLCRNLVHAQKNLQKTSDQTSSFVALPEKVEWVLDSHRGDEWKPFVRDRAIPDSVKEQWKERFLLAMNADNRTQ